MHTNDISEFLIRNTYLVVVTQDNDLVSIGSAFPINEQGDLITAAHVVTGRLPYTSKDIEGIEIYCKKPQSGFNRYNCLALAPQLSLPQFNDPVFIDSAILTNTEKCSENEFFKISRCPPVVGSDVLMCGYSDEVTMPLSLEQNFNLAHPDFDGIVEAVEAYLVTHMQFSMVKRGMIGRTYEMTFVNLDNTTGHSIYIDNAIHSGASGGPVVNLDNEIVGIITDRALTSYSTSDTPGLKVPSGSTIAISANLAIKAWEVLCE